MQPGLDFKAVWQRVGSHCRPGAGGGRRGCCDRFEARGGCPRPRQVLLVTVRPLRGSGTPCGRPAAYPGGGTHAHTPTHALPNTHTHPGTEMCLMATAEAPPAAQCAVHMAEPEGAAPAFLASGSPDKPCLSPAPRHERRVPFPKRWGTERARQLGFLLLQRFCLFICFRRKFGRLLTKLFGLNHVSPNARSGRGRASRPLCISECFHRSAVPG